MLKRTYENNSLRNISSLNYPDIEDSLWKQIEGFPTYYVHPTGYVKSIKIHHNIRKREKTTKEKIITRFLDADGYIKVNLVETVNKQERRKQFFVHRLIAIAFIYKPIEKDFVNHIDGVKTNSHIDNIEWCTSSENELHSYKILGKVNMAGKSKRLFLPDDIVHIRGMYIDGCTYAVISNRYKCNAATIRNIILGKTYKDV